jgi:hypothetical protein
VEAASWHNALPVGGDAARVTVARSAFKRPPRARRHPETTETLFRRVGNSSATVARDTAARRTAQADGRATDKEMVR